MEDHHVDRPGVDAQQCVKLTGTNRSIGLISDAGQTAHAIRAQSSGIGDQTDVGRDATDRPANSDLIPDPRSPTPVFDDLVVMARGNTPDPIPNSAVKTLSADGTAS